MTDPAVDAIHKRETYLERGGQWQPQSLSSESIALRAGCASTSPKFTRPANTLVGVGRNIALAMIASEAVSLRKSTSRPTHVAALHVAMSG